MPRLRILQAFFGAPRRLIGRPVGVVVASGPVALARRLLVLVSVLGVAGGALAADEIHWTITGQTSVTFSWRGSPLLPLGTTPTIRYGTSPGMHTGIGLPTLSLPLPASSTGPFWETKLTGLDEGTLYYYVIGDGPERTFRTPPPRGGSDFTVYAEGDIGSTNTLPRVAVVQDLIAAGTPAFVLAVGDLTYGDLHGQDDVDQHFNDVMGWSENAAYMPAWGNHDWASPDDLSNYRGRFDFPNPQDSPDSPAATCLGAGCKEDWYWFDYGNVRFIAYPEPWSRALQGTDATWADWYTRADRLMAEAQADPDITFIVTFGHRPASSSNYATGADSTLKGLLDTLGDRYSKYVLNVAGHHHDYERTIPQHGVVHVTVGTGGEDLHSQVTPCFWRMCPQPSWSAFRALHFGVLRLRFNPTIIEGAFICGPASSEDDVACAVGSVVDSFTVR